MFRDPNGLNALLNVKVRLACKTCRRRSIHSTGISTKGQPDTGDTGYELWKDDCEPSLPDSQPETESIRGRTGGMMHRGCRRCAMWIDVDAPLFVCGLLCEIHEPLLCSSRFPLAQLFALCLHQRAHQRLAHRLDEYHRLDRSRKCPPRLHFFVRVRSKSVWHLAATPSSVSYSAI
jgi:hypothetical protein